MAVEVDVQVTAGCEAAPPPALFRQWVLAALEDAEQQAAVAIRIVAEAEGRELNLRYRSVDAATNVLSFPSDLPAEVCAELDQKPLGDLVFCAPVIESEAQEQGKPVRDHWTHLTVHGILHLLGYDHQDHATATVMEALEIEILERLGVANPYAIR